MAQHGDAGQGGSGVRAEELFAAFLERLEQEPGLEFQAWLAKVPADAPRKRLAAMHTKWNEGRALLGGGATSDSIEFGYEMLEVIGSGGFGTVWRARNKALGRIDAIKVVRQQDVRADARRRFVEEAQRLASVDHPNVVKVHAIEEHGVAGGQCEIRLVLEYVKGQTLEQILGKSGPFSPHEAARIGIDVCRALAALHGKGLVHLDVKTGNIMRGERGRIVLLDFGLARPNAQGADVAVTPLCGSPPYMAPELFGGKGELGPRTDVYSLGVTLYRCATGRYPFKFERNEELFDAITEGRRVPIADVLPDVPEPFAALLERAMATDPKARFESAGAFEAALRAFVGETAPVAQRTPSKRLVWALVGVGAVAAVALFAALNRPTNDEESNGVAKANEGTRTGGEELAPITDEARPIDAQVKFFRHRGLAQQPELLGAGADVDVGDLVYLTAEASEPFYLYAFNQDLAGNQFRLVPEDSSHGFLPGGRVLRFPPADSALPYWEVNVQGGTEHIFVIASPEPLPELLDLIAYIAAPQSERDQNRGAGNLADARSRLRGLGKKSPGSETPSAASPDAPAKLDLLVEFAYLEANLDPARRVKLQHFEMTND